ncbi:interleukin-23 receptor-like [Chiloscyllium plagiosum]|uniref:interleukin-23 receptor-like n=1 Tax=Chiloscyllium plagiosum TaxID=36176 RepID=UPI001CB7DBDA|nr:interleukin-23 receptor-like [Chiloscyllium plagiosum]
MGLTNIIWTVASITAMMLCVRSNGLSVIQCPGKVLVKPALVFLVGSNISVTCVSIEQNCDINEFELYRNEKQIQMERFNKTAAHHWMINVTTQDSTIYCYIDCVDGAKELVCVASLQPGYPPDQPKDLICIWQHNKMMCTWIAGKQTFLETYYALHIQSEGTGKEQIFPTNFSSNSVTVPGNHLQKASIYRVWIQATNALGNATSKRLTFSLHDIVKPDAPMITKVEFINNSVPKTIIHWRSSTNAECQFEIRYRIISDPNITWTLVAKNAFSINGNSGHFYNWVPFKEYEFQIRCNLIKSNNYWSDWSNSFINKTPEAEPAGVLDVWSSCEPIKSNKHKRIIIYWKPLHPQETRGIILGYRIFYQQNGREMTIQVCSASETQYSWQTPWTPDNIFVTAFNSKGDSTPAMLHIGESNLMAPRNLSVRQYGGSRIYVEWEPPDEVSEPVQDYVVDWREAADNNKQLLDWKRLPKNNHSLLLGQFSPLQEYLAEGRSIKPRKRYNISVTAMYLKGRGKSCSAQGYSIEGKPTTGPNVSVLKLAGQQVLLKWGEISLEEQQGFITNYTIYLKRGADGSYLASYNIINPTVRTYWLTLGFDDVYIVYMTATTAAGEGAKGTELAIKQDYYSIALPLQLSVAITIPAAFLLTLAFAKSVRQRIKSMCKVFLPGWAQEKFPNVENSNVVKGLQKNDAVPFLHTAALLVYNDPPITEVEETLLPRINKSLIQTVHRNSKQQIEEAAFENPISDISEAHNSHLSQPNEDTETMGYKPQTSSRCQPIVLSHNDDESIPNIGSNQVKVYKELNTPGFDRFPDIFSIDGILDMNTDLTSNHNGIQDDQNYILKEEEEQFPANEHHRTYITEGLLQEQTLLPDEFVDCLLHKEDDSTDIKSYFPQIVAIQ